MSERSIAVVCLTALAIASELLVVDLVKFKTSVSILTRPVPAYQVPAQRTILPRLEHS